MFDWPSLIFPVFVAVALFIIISRNKTLTELYERQAMKRNGKVQKTLWVFPRLILSDQGREVRVCQTSGGKNSPPIAHLKCHLGPVRDHDIRIGPEHVFLKLGKSLGMQDIQIGSPGFDGSFLIRGKDEATVRAFLSPEVQECILQLEEYSPTIRIEKRTFDLSVSGTLDKEREYDRFIEAGLEMIRNAHEIG